MKMSFALAGFAMLAATSADAGYVPHFDLTPYQIVQVGGQCVQAQTGPSGYSVTLATCSAANDYQKFYVLTSGDNDVTPQTQTGSGVLVRVALASTFDTAPVAVGQYNLLAAIGGTLVVDSANTINADNAHKWFISRRANSLPNWTQVANEYGSFTVTGTRTVRYGANGSWITKVVPGLLYPNASVPCTNTFFGGDPTYGVIKACYIETTNQGSEAFTKYEVLFANAAGPQCMGVDFNGAFGLVPCAGTSEDLRTFWLRPVGYPGP